MSTEHTNKKPFLHASIKCKEQSEPSKSKCICIVRNRNNGKVVGCQIMTLVNTEIRIQKSGRPGYFAKYGGGKVVRAAADVMQVVF